MSILSRALLVALPVAGLMGFAAGWAWRGDRAERIESDRVLSSTTEALQQEQAVRVIEQKQAETLAAIGAKHEQDRTAAAIVPASVVADLRAGRLQLRDDLATCSTSLLSQAVAGSVERDAHAELRAEVAGAAVQIGRDADDHVRASQAIVRADRE